MSAASLTTTSTKTSTGRRALSLQDGTFNATAVNATAAMVLGSALRAQLAASLGVSVRYTLVTAADTTCTGGAGDPPTGVFVHDVFGSGDPINSDVLFGGQPKANPENFTSVPPQGPLQNGTCVVVWTVVLQVPVGEVPPTFAAPSSAPMNTNVTAALAVYMNAEPASAAGMIATYAGGSTAAEPASDSALPQATIAAIAGGVVGGAVLVAGVAAVMAAFKGTTAAVVAKAPLSATV